MSKNIQNVEMRGRGNGWLSESDYNFIYSRAPRICVDLVIKNRKGVYLTKRDVQPYKGKYHLPGGRVRFRESIETAIDRIARNEIGSPVVIKKLLGFMEFPREMQEGNKRHSISLAFLVVPSFGVNIKKVRDENILSVHRKFLKSLDFI